MNKEEIKTIVKLTVDAILEDHYIMLKKDQEKRKMESHDIKMQNLMDAFRVLEKENAHSIVSISGLSKYLKVHKRTVTSHIEQHKLLEHKAGIVFIR